MNQKKIGFFLKELRKEKGITQEELAETFGVTSQSISKWELGINCPDITMLPKIADYYRVSIDELLGYKPLSSINSIYIDNSRPSLFEEKFSLIIEIDNSSYLHITLSKYKNKKINYINTRLTFSEIEINNSYSTRDQLVFSIQENLKVF